MKPGRSTSTVNAPPGSCTASGTVDAPGSGVSSNFPSPPAGGAAGACAAAAASWRAPRTSASTCSRCGPATSSNQVNDTSRRPGCTAPRSMLRQRSSPGPGVA
ncbi:MAG: hypothetical protein QM704_07260 [Anaeromyxobacteraceae bacterium]